MFKMEQELHNTELHHEFKQLLKVFFKTSSALKYYSNITII